MFGRKYLVWLFLLCIVNLLFFGSVCCAQEHAKIEYPTRPITLIVPWSAGGGTDIGSRVLAKYAEKYLGQPIVILNVPGGGSEVGIVQMLRSKPDGYTIAGFNTASVTLTVIRKAKYHPVNDVKPICLYVSDPRLFVVRADDERFRRFDDFVNYAKENPGKLTIGTSGAGSSGHFSILFMNKVLGIKTTPVHFGSGGDTTAALLGGHVDSVAQTIGEALPMIKSGKAKPIVIAAEKRYPDFPDVPTFKEKGVDLVIASNRGIAAPKDTPDEIVQILADAFKKATEEPEFLKDMSNLGLPVKYLNTLEFSMLIKQEYELYKELAKEF